MNSNGFPSRLGRYFEERNKPENHMRHVFSVHVGISWNSHMYKQWLENPSSSVLSSFPVSSDRENDLTAHASMSHMLRGKGGLIERIDVVDVVRRQPCA
jgi:hypothetical protein